MSNSTVPAKTRNFMSQFRDTKTKELKNLTSAQFMEVWSHYDHDGEQTVFLFSYCLLIFIFSTTLDQLSQSDFFLNFGHGHISRWANIIQLAQLCIYCMEPIEEEYESASHFDVCMCMCVHVGYEDKITHIRHIILLNCKMLSRFKHHN